MKKLIFLSLAVLFVFTFIGSAYACPRLQTYIVDSKYYYSYGLDRRSWITNKRNFDLNVVAYWGHASQPQPARDFLNTYVAINVPMWQSGKVWINGHEITSFTNFCSAVPDGVRPAWHLPISLPSIVGKWNFQELGPINNSMRNAMYYDHNRVLQPGWGDMFSLNVTVQGFDWANFDAVGTNSCGQTFTSWPCQDSSFYAVPEPGTLSLLGVGLLGIIPLIRKKKK